MDRLDSMRLLTRVIDRRSFTAAAVDLSIPRSTATEAIRSLERRLGVRLLDRTTRVVTPTLDGEAYYLRCLSILAEVDEADSSFRSASPSGQLRVNAHPVIARTFLVPHLPAFLKQYPQLNLHLGEDDRLVDLVREGVDCVIRSGQPTEEALIGRRLTTLPEVTCASPHYLARHGVPASPDALEGHEIIGFWSSRVNEILPIEFDTLGVTRSARLPARVTTSAGDTMVHLACLGLGMIQVPRYRVEGEIAAGNLVEILSNFRPRPTPLSILYPQSRQLSPRVRAFVDWAIDAFSGMPV